MSTTETLFTCCNANDPLIFRVLANGVGWFLFDLLNISQSSGIGQFLHYFLYTSTKIFLLLLSLIYLVGLIRAGLNVEKVRRFLKGKNRLIAYTLAALFGAVTPFCSCAAVPIFIAFTASGIPLGITIAFLVTSPIINEIGVFLLFSEFGRDFAVLYISIGMVSGILTGFLFDTFQSQKFLRDDLDSSLGDQAIAGKEKGKISLMDRHHFAKNQVVNILKKVYLWVFIGISIAGVLNLFLTPEIVSQSINQNHIIAVPLAVLLGIPLYSSPAGIIPIGTVLLQNGVKVGTVLAFMMSCTAASLPEFILLKQVLTAKGVLFLFGILLVLFTGIGIVLNLV